MRCPPECLGRDGLGNLCSCDKAEFPQLAYTQLIELHNLVPETAVGGFHSCTERRSVTAGGRCNRVHEAMSRSAVGVSHRTPLAIAVEAVGLTFTARAMVGNLP